LLILAVALVGAVCVPLWQWTGQGANQQGIQWTAARISQMLLGPEQIFSYCASVWAGFILISRYLEVRRQKRAFGLGLLPTDVGVCILPEDARLLQREVEEKTARGGPYILGNMIRLALSKYAVSRTSRDVADTVRTQADVDMGKMVSSMSTVQYLAWAIPAIGFIGTVRGLAGSLNIQDGAVSVAASQLNVAFDTTLVALALSMVVMFLLHSVQRDEETLVMDCQQYCLEHLVTKLYDADHEHSLQHEGDPYMPSPMMNLPPRS
jgi:biopolymer transport protein ExbB/TolQ